MTTGGVEDWDELLTRWAQRRRDIRAIIQLGSRAQTGAEVDQWSDYDYQIVTTRPSSYENGAFCRELGVPWAIRAGRGVITDIPKVTVVYDRALEADFIIVDHQSLRLALLLLRWPGFERYWPPRLKAGIRDLRIVAGRGWRVVKGGGAWEARYRRIRQTHIVLSREAFERICADFWVQAVWIIKKLQRGERLAASRSASRVLLEHVYRLVQEEAFLQGRNARPDLRYAERWLSAERLNELKLASSPASENILNSCQQLFTTFSNLSESISKVKEWPIPSYRELRAWLGIKLDAIGHDRRLSV